MKAVILKSKCDHGVVKLISVSLLDHRTRRLVEVDLVSAIHAYVHVKSSEFIVQQSLGDVYCSCPFVVITVLSLSCKQLQLATSQ